MQAARHTAGPRDAGSIEVERGGDGRPRSPFAVQGAWDCGPGTIAPAGSSPSAAAPAPRPSAPAEPARTLFRIRFESAMSDDDADRLRDALDMALHLHPKHPAVRPPLGVAPLPFGGLFLVRDEGRRKWALEGRTWANPSAAAVRESELEAILAARRLDPSVPYPAPLRRPPAR